MGKEPNEWFKQAEYDMKTAEAMFETKRYIYVIFMCHLSLEKAFKAFYLKKLGSLPPKVHNLLYLIEKIGVPLPKDLYEVVFVLNRTSIPARYPDDLQKMKKEYNKQKTGDLLVKSREVLKWLKAELQK
jgi:HEPN domain-containing protein